jgi:hypothetical protein
MKAIISAGAPRPRGVFVFAARVGGQIAIAMGHK